MNTKQHNFQEIGFYNIDDFVLYSYIVKVEIYLEYFKKKCT